MSDTLLDLDDILAARAQIAGGVVTTPLLAGSSDPAWAHLWLKAENLQFGGAFKLHVMDLAGGTPVAITDTNADESPSFAPNGRQIIYATRQGGRDALMTTTLDGKVKA